MYFTPSLRVTLAVFLSELKDSDSFTFFLTVSIFFMALASFMNIDIKALSVLLPPMT